MNDPWRQDRSDFFIRTFQIEGLCAALRHLTAVNLDPGPAARQMLTAVRAGLMMNLSGKPNQIFPEITDSTSGADLLVIAEVLRATVNCFLSPEDLAERGKMGFHVD